MAEYKVALTEEEKAKLQGFQTKVHPIIIDLGKIELQLSDLLNVKEQVKKVMADLVVDQNAFFAELETKYGAGGVDPQSYEYIVNDSE
jgi:hypothetical protein